MLNIDIRIGNICQVHETINYFFYFFVNKILYVILMIEENKNKNP